MDLIGATNQGRSDRCRGSGRSTHAYIAARHGRPARRDIGRNGQRSRPRQESEGPIVAMKPGNAGGAKGPWFRVRLDEPRVRRSA